MKKLKVAAAALGWSVLERNRSQAFAGLRFSPAPSVFPAVTCVHQASLRTGKGPLEHGVISNGFWIDDLARPMFWEQSHALVKGERIWRGRRGKISRVGMYFFQQSLGESVDAVVSPAPIHKHGGGMIMDTYVAPAEISSRLNRRMGAFPLHRYWGPFASPKVGDRVIDWFEASLALHDVDEAYLYLPTLDYFAQKYGPGSTQDNRAFAVFKRQLERLARFCDASGAELSVEGDYDITPVVREEVMPNLILRRNGLFRVRYVGSRAYPDFHASAAFAVCDHEFCFIAGEERETAAQLLLETGLYELGEKVSERFPVLVASRGSACSYKWWTSRAEAPDWASHVDIHNKPGYDPGELFFMKNGIIRGTHGRRALVAKSE